MANRIKGITIEIAGDTTKLDKALRGVNSAVRQSQSKLRDINKLLKLDPSNVELLRQKQDALKTAIGASEEKTAKLRDAIAQLKEAGGEKSAEQIDALEREIIETENEAKNLKKELQQLGNVKMTALGEKMKSVGNSMKTVGQNLKYISGAAAGAIGISVKEASDLEESMNKVDVAFGKNADTVKEFSDTALTSFGIAKGTALDMAATYGDMGTSMGLTTKEASIMATSLTGLAGDLASFKNIGIDQAMTALNGIFTGETESLKGLGVVMTQTNLDAFALANGFGKTTKEMTEAEKVNLRYAYVLNATKNAQGDFARTNDGFANQARMLQEGLKELAATIGEALLPVATKVVSVINSVVTAFAKMSPEMQRVVGIVLAVVAGLSPLLIILGTLVSSIGSIVMAFGAMSGAIAFITGPVGIAIAVTGALVAALIYLQKHGDELRAKLIAAFKAIGAAAKKIFASIVSAIVSPFKTAYNRAKAIVDNLKSLVNRIKGFFQFKISAPHIPLPHFTVSPPGWKIGDLVKGKIPSLSVKWFAKGGIVNGATLIGAGEKGAEGIIPLDAFWNKMDAFANNMLYAMGNGGPRYIQNDIYLGGAKVGEQIVRLYDKSKLAIG